MMRNSFCYRLRDAIYNFDVNDAIKLSIELHEFEAAGGQLGLRENCLWEKLTVMIKNYKVKFPIYCPSTWV